MNLSQAKDYVEKNKDFADFYERSSSMKLSLSNRLKYEDYKNQVDWAKVSQSIHDVIDKTVIGKQDLKAMQGKTVKFVGCFSVNKPDEILITPVELNVQ